jgi:site-specific recombinase XerD
VQPLVRSRRQKISLFLQWLSERHRSLAAVQLRDVDDFLIFNGTNGWSRKSARGYADALRAFFRYAAKCGWCKPGIGEGISSPRIYAQEGLPEGPEWKDVQRLLEGIKGNNAAALRARAALFLLAVYGLRSAAAGPKVAAIFSVVESCRRMKIPVREYLSAVLPGLNDLSIQRVAALIPKASAARQ